MPMKIIQVLKALLHIQNRSAYLPFMAKREAALDVIIRDVSFAEGYSMSVVLSVR